MTDDGHYIDDPLMVVNAKPDFNDLGIMSDEELKAMSKDDANKLLCRRDKSRWVELHNATANLFFIKNGNIENVEPSGWWY